MKTHVTNYFQDQYWEKFTISEYLDSIKVYALCAKELKAGN